MSQIKEFGLQEINSKREWLDCVKSSQS